LTNRLARHYEQDSIYFPLKIFWKELLDPANNGMMLLMNRFPIFREKGNLVKIFRLRKKSLNENRMFDVSKYYNGFIPFNSAQPVKPEKYEYGVISGENLETFKKLLAEFSRDKIMVIFVRTPEYVPFIDESQFDAADKYLTIEANRHGFYYYNYSRERKSYINYGKEYFSTVGHLNEAGSELFSKMLYADLKDILATK
jgi:hypothetical protein